MTEELTPIQGQNIEAGSPSLQGERLSFTGTLASMTHQQAHELAEQHGGVATPHVSQQTTMLVIGEEGWPLQPNGQPSVKLQQVNEWRGEDHNIRILTESQWLHLIGLQEKQQEVHRLYTPAMLSQMLEVSVGVIRRWERLGLIKAVKKVLRLPYFDFQEVASVRRLSELLSAGVSRREIERSLGKLNEVMHDVERPLAQLELLVRNSHVVCRDQFGLMEPASGQRLFEYESPSAQAPATRRETLDVSEIDESPIFVHADQPPSHDQWTFQEWFDQGCLLLEDHQVEAAIEAFRLCLMERPHEADVHFHLADCLYRNGNYQGALERFYVSVELDHDHLQAWTLLGCVHAELGDQQSALDSFDIALKAHPDFPDVNFHKAQVLHDLGRTREAVAYWQKYLQFDSRGPWAETARQHLQQAQRDSSP